MKSTFFSKKLFWSCPCAASAAVLFLLVMQGYSQTAKTNVGFNLKQPGKVSAAIYDTRGCMVRELVRAEPMQSGSHSLNWDGLDMDGKPAPAGSYEWRVLQTQGLKSEYLMNVGTSVGDRWWPGNHTGPTALATAEDSLIVGAMSEGPPMFTRSGFDGKVIWEHSDFEVTGLPRHVTIGGGKVFCLWDSGKVFGLDFATGQRVGKPLPALFPVKTFVFGKAESNETTVPLAAFDTTHDMGWNTTVGMTQTESGLTCNALEPRVFEAAIPNGQYLIRYEYGDPAQDTMLVEVQPNGNEPTPITRVTDKITWWQLPPVKAGTKVAPIFLPKFYNQPYAVNVNNGRLSIKFIPGSPLAKPKEAHWGLRKIEVIALADRLAADDSSLVLSSNGGGEIAWIDPITGAILDSIKLDGVRDVAMGSRHTVFALLKDSVVSFTRDAKQPQTRITGLADPVALGVDAKSGEVVVAEGGANQRVKCFSANFTLKSVHGREGGRKFGRYEPRDFSSLTGIATDGHGGFVVIERFGTPRRTARFNAQGEVLREWFGGMDFYSRTALDPADPTIGWLRQDEEHVVRVKIDYAKREWRPLAAYRWTEMFDPPGAQSGDPSLYLGRMSFPPWLAGRVSTMRVMRHDINGKSELMLEFDGQPLLLVYDEAHDCLRPLAAMGVISCDLWADGTTKTVDELPAAWVDAIRHAGGDPADLKTRYKYAHYSWADENGDGKIQAGELRVGEVHRSTNGAASANGGTCMRVDQGLNAWIGGGHTDKNGIYHVFKPERITACGAPVWPLEGKVGPTTEHTGDTRSLLPTADGGSFVLLAGNGDGTKATFTYDTATHGWAWPSICTDGMALLRLDANGNRIWRSATKAARFPHPRGQLHDAYHLDREVKGCVPVLDHVEQPCEFWTTDGLYVGGLFDGRDPYDGHDLNQPGSPPNRLYTWLGTKAKHVFQNSFDQTSPLCGDDYRAGGDVGELPDGSVVFLGQGENNNPCYRITGWDGWVRQRGQVRIEKPAREIAQQGTGLKAEYFTNTGFSGSPAITRNDARLWFGANAPWPKDIQAQDFSVRWTGFIEPRFTEDYCLSIYARGDFKLWIDGKEVAWANEDYPRDKELHKGHSLPIPLRAGERVPVKIEYCANMDTPAFNSGPAFHFNWESLSQPVEHLPTAVLYPAASLTKPGGKPK